MYKRTKAVFVGLLLTAQAFNLSAQTVAEKLTRAFAVFEKDSQLRSGIASLYVVDATTGAVLFDRNSGIGLAPASTQKIITAAAAYELLGKNFRYPTRFVLAPLANGTNELRIQPSGDPTLGSWRWRQTALDSVLKRLAKTFGPFLSRSPLAVSVVKPQQWSGEATPGGWIWDDVGNYYGAGAEALNWHENQYDLILRSDDEVGGRVYVFKTNPVVPEYSFRSEARAGPKGSGDNAYIYFGKKGNLVVRGTISAGEKAFTISGSFPSAQEQFVTTLTTALQASPPAKAQTTDSIVHTETSPPLDSISYWFLKRSINLYGEALAQKMAEQAGAEATSESGAAVIKKFWAEKGIGIDKTELSLHDGSGLSPLNRVTTHAQVSVLRYAKTQPWFDSYYAGFPDYNGMKLKSGTINGVKSFCGYHAARDGKAYVLSFIVNNYNGSPAALVRKMYAVLDVLK